MDSQWDLLLGGTVLRFLSEFLFFRVEEDMFFKAFERWKWSDIEE